MNLKSSPSIALQDMQSPHNISEAQASLGRGSGRADMTPHLLHAGIMTKPPQSLRRACVRAHDKSDALRAPPIPAQWLTTSVSSYPTMAAQEEVCAGHLQAEAMFAAIIQQGTGFSRAHLHTGLLMRYLPMCVLPYPCVVPSIIAQHF